MHSTTLLATAALAATTLAAPVASSAPATTSPKLFKIQAHVEDSTNDDSEYNQYLSGFHVGAGESTLVGTKEITEALSFSLNGTMGYPSFLYIPQGNRTDIPPATVGLLEQAPYLSDAPAGYDYVSADLGSGGLPGFFRYTDKLSNEYIAVESVPNGPDFAGFALCHVNGTSPYFSVGPQYQLLWKTDKTVTPADAKCADVGLKIIEVIID